MWLHGSHSTSTGGVDSRKGHISALATWFDTIMRWVLTTALGVPTEPDVNRNLPMVSSVIRLNADITRGSSDERSIAANGVAPPTSALLPPATTTPLCRCATASMAGRKRSIWSAKTTPGRSSSMLALSLPKSFDISELPVEIAHDGTPMCIAANISSACSMPLSERITTGRSGDRFCPRSQVAIATTRCRASP